MTGWGNTLRLRQYKLCDKQSNHLINQMSTAFAVTPRTMRYYDSVQLLCPQRSGQQRLHHKRDRARLKLNLRGKRFGFSLDEIRQLLELYDIGDQQQTQFKQTYKLAQARLKNYEQTACRIGRNHSRAQSSPRTGPRPLRRERLG